MHALLILILLVAVILGPQFWVRSVLKRYQQKDEANFPGNGGELARHLLDRFQLDDVKVEVTETGDHYDPRARAVRLTRPNLEGRSLTAITVATHEVGHALQHAGGESLFHWRTRLAELARTGQMLGSFLLFAGPLIGIFTKAPAPAALSLLAAFLVLGSSLLVQLLTLPVELDASFNKAMPLLRSGYLEPHQYAPARHILRAAAWTYVAGALANLLNFWQWLRVLRR